MMRKLTKNIHLEEEKKRENRRELKDEILKSKVRRTEQLSKKKENLSKKKIFSNFAYFLLLKQV